MTCEQCHQPTIDFDVQGSDCRFVLRRCDFCSTNEWFLDGAPATIGAVLDELRHWAGTSRASDRHRQGGARLRSVA